jgi:hypothetical protein
VACPTYALATRLPERFPSYEDGFYTFGRNLGIDTSLDVYADTARMNSAIGRIVANYCGSAPDCKLLRTVKTPVNGAAGKQSQATKVEIVMGSIDHPWTSHAISMVRSCPNGAVLVDDHGNHYDNRDGRTSYTPVACEPSRIRPALADLGAPMESGANQCPIGNAPTVGNPINPLTMSKIETATDYDDPSGSGLDFVRRYHSGAMSAERDQKHPPTTAALNVDTTPWVVSPH